MLIRFAIYPKVNLLDVAGPAQVFSELNERLADTDLRIEACSTGGGPVGSDTGLVLDTLAFAAAPDAADIFVVPGSSSIETTLEDRALVSAIRAQSDRAGLTASVCTGSLLLAEAGLMHGRRTATHWRYARRFGEKYPDARLDPDAIFVRDGEIWSSAGVSTGIDLALAIVAHGFGRARAFEIARELVVPMVRPGGQKQFSSVLEFQSRDPDQAFTDLHAWVAQNLSGDLSVDRLAERTRMSPRSFARRYKTATGTTPARMVEALRLDHAQSLLRETGLGIDVIARNCGYSGYPQFTRAFSRVIGVDPSAYRRQFQGSAARGANGLADGGAG